MSGDAYHMTSPSEDGSGGALAMEAAMRDAGITGEQIGYVNAHGTSTPAGDVAEVKGIKRALGEAGSKQVLAPVRDQECWRPGSLIRSQIKRL